MKWAEEPDHIWESDTSDIKEEEEPHHNRWALDSDDKVEQVYRPTLQGYQAQARDSASLWIKLFKKTHRAHLSWIYPGSRRSNKIHFLERLH
jgi:hypothetical protein